MSCLTETLCLLIGNSPIPQSPRLNNHSTLWFHEFYYFRYLIWVETCGVCLSVTDLQHLVQCFQGLPILWHTVECLFFFHTKQYSIVRVCVYVRVYVVMVFLFCPAPNPPNLETVTFYPESKIILRKSLRLGFLVLLKASGDMKAELRISEHFWRSNRTRWLHSTAWL